MKKELSALLICGCAALVMAGGVVGTYYGLNPIKKNGSDTTEPVEEVIPEEVKAFYGENVKRAKTFEASETQGYVLSSYAVQLADSKVGFYYKLSNAPAKPTYDEFTFAIGVTDNTVTKYKFIEQLSGEGHGVDEVQGNTTIFIGYKLGGEDVTGGLSTTSDSYTTMKKAVDAALKDCKDKDASSILGVTPGVQLSKEIEAMFGADNPTAEVDFTSEVTSSYIEVGKKVTLGDGTFAYYYQLTTVPANPVYDKVRFSIGIKNETVTNYKYIELIEGEGHGDEVVYNNKRIFIGYTLGGEDVTGGVTVMDTYGSMKKAVDAALTDCKER